MIRLAFTSVVLAVLVACGGSSEPTADGAIDAATVDQVVAVAKKIRANPADKDAILAEAGMTRPKFEDLLYRIAEDPKASATYAKKLGAK